MNVHLRRLSIGLGIGLAGIAIQWTLEASVAFAQKPVTTSVLVPTIPPGTILAFGGEKIPVGYLLCNGQAYPRTGPYKSLYDAIGLAWGRGDDSGTKFNVPDLSGMFLRGVDNGHKVDPDSTSRFAKLPGGNAGDKVGSFQSDALKRHSHKYDKTGPFVKDGYNFVSTDWANETNTTHNIHESGDSTESRPMNAYVSYIIKM